MTERELKGYLESIKVLSEKRDKKLEQIDELRSVATNCVAPTDKEAIQSSGSADKMANIVGRMVDLIREVDELDELIKNRKSIIYRLSDKLSTDRHSQYIKLRFLEKNGFYDTVMKMELTDSTARRIERKAISELARIMNTAEYNI